VPLENISQIEKSIYQKLDTTYSSLADEIKEKKDLTPEIEKEIK
jgi:F0F1-type ATP synthase alpha subunit